MNRYASTPLVLEDDAVDAELPRKVRRPQHPATVGQLEALAFDRSGELLAAAADLDVELGLDLRRYHLG